MGLGFRPGCTAGYQKRLFYDLLTLRSWCNKLLFLNFVKDGAKMRIVRKALQLFFVFQVFGDGDKLVFAVGVMSRPMSRNSPIEGP